MIHAFSQLMHNKSHEITHLVTHFVRPHWQKLQPERPRSPSWSFLAYPNPFKGVEAGSSNYLLIQLVPLY